MEPITSTYVTRYPEYEYANQTHHQKQQQQQQQQHQQQQNYLHNYQQNQNNQHYESSYRQRHSDYGRNFDAPAYRSYYDEDYGGASTYGRAPGVSNGGNGYRYQQHESSYHRDYNGAGAIGNNNSRYYSHQQQHSNGYNNNNFALHKNQLNANAYDGGFEKIFYQKRPVNHHKIHCCCFSFKWPPWGYEPCEPPTPIYYRKNYKPSLRQQNKRFNLPESPHSNIN